MPAEILKAGPDAYRRAVNILRTGGLVALPTETVYGLAALATDDDAVSKVYQAKGRPAHNPLITHILKPDHVSKYVNPNDAGLLNRLSQAFWPGPLTMVMPKKNTVAISPKATAGLGTMAIRCPDVPWANAFLALDFEGPLVMPSANRSGHVSPTTAHHVADDLGGVIDLIIDGGPCPGGIESTVLGLGSDFVTLLRPGSTPASEFVPYISDLRLPEKKAAPSAPGMLKSHYAPNAAVRLNATEKRPGEAYLGFGQTNIDADLNLSEKGDLSEAARNLYAFLRRLDNVETIAVAPIPNLGLGEAINDRLQRAAADR